MASDDNLRLGLRVAAGGARRWQAAVAARLAARKDLVVGHLAGAAKAPPAGLEALFAFDRAVGRSLGETAADRVAALDLAEAGSDLDLILDLDGATAPAGATPILVATCLGLPPLEGAVAAVLEARVPVLEITRHATGETPRLVGRWRVAVEDGRSTLAAVSQILGRLAHMAALAAPAAARGETLAIAPADPRDATLSPLAPARLFLRSLEARIAGKLDRLARAPADWRTIWRRRTAASDPVRPQDDDAPFHLLPDDGARFYADPFPWSVGGRDFLFLEEFPYATGKGILSVVEIGAEGPIGTPRPFLEQDCHLSWPQIFEADGTVWMIPETSGRRTVELWRAVELPDRFEKHAVLLSDIDVGDATPVRTADGWFLFGTVRERWCSSWDALHVWHAPALEGPWTPISDGPVVVDPATARPAGRPIATADGLLRPVQDSTGGYGCGLALTRIDRLDATGFAETKLARFATPVPLAGLHTWNRLAGANGLLEVMDVFARTKDFGASRRLDLTPV
jgi:hypothetical protein